MSFFEILKRAAQESQVSQKSRRSRRSQSGVYETSEANPTRRYETVDARDIRANTGVHRRKHEDSATIPRKPVAPHHGNEARGSFGQYRETAAIPDDDHDSDDEAEESDASSVDSLEGKLLQFRKAEVDKRIDNGDWEGAEQAVRDILKSLEEDPGAELDAWEIKLATILLRRGNAQDAIQILTTLGNRNLEARTGAAVMFLAAETHYTLGNLDEARRTCDSALKAARKIKKDRDMVWTGQKSMYLMSLILDAMGRKVDASFYRGQLTEDQIAEFDQMTASRNERIIKSKQETPTKSGQDTQKQEDRKVILSAESLELMKVHKLQLDPTGTLLTGREDDMVSAFAGAVGSTSTYDLVELLLEGVMIVPDFPNFATTTYFEALYSAVRFLNFDIIQKLLLKAANSNVDLSPDGYYLALRLLAYHSSPYEGEDVVKIAGLLRSFGANVNLEDADYDDTPLHTAARSANDAMIRWLMLNGADVGMRNNRGQTAIQVARDERTKELITELTPRGLYARRSR